MSTVDRDALIEAAAKARYERSTGHIWAELPEQTRDCYRTECGNWLDAILPLIAGAIEALKVREFDPDASDLALAAGVVGNGHLDRAAALVRSLLGTDSDQ